jgi:hypothetical protein
VEGCLSEIHNVEWVEVGENIHQRRLVALVRYGVEASFLISISKKCIQHHRHIRNTTAPHASPTFTATTTAIDIHRDNKRSRFHHRQRPTATASSP